MYHRTVLAKEAVEIMAVRKDGIYVDGTMGDGGHSLEILKKLGSGGRLIAMDWDRQAIAAAGKRLKARRGDITILRANFKDIGFWLERMKIKAVDGVILDLGLSSGQLKDKKRGFSFRYSAPLDMRMDSRNEIRASGLLEKSSCEELKNIFLSFGEERYSSRVAGAIKARQKKRPVTDALDLAEIVAAVIPRRQKFRRIHPATKIFQALRIAVNRELENLGFFLKQIVPRLEQRGRLAVISYHSLEDRMVKNFFRQLARACVCPADFPVCLCRHKPLLRIITPKPVRPGREEIKINPSSRSARLRAAQKI